MNSSYAKTPGYYFQPQKLSFSSDFQVLNLDRNGTMEGSRGTIEGSEAKMDARSEFYA